MQLTPDIEKLIDLAIMEDYSMGDATTDALIPNETIGSATVVADEGGTIAGLSLAVRIFQKMDSSLETTILIPDGSKVTKGDRILEINGYLSSILTAERTALNFLRKLSGVATETSKYVDEISHTKSRIVDTRKTTPGFRALEKYAVRMGGGHNHRQNLSDGILIKDNHVKTLNVEGLNLTEVIQKAKSKASHTIKVEVEVETVEQAVEAVSAGADIILLDNMSTQDMEKAVKSCLGRAVTEASGGINLKTVRSVAETGVNLISVGAITHSAPNLDLSLDID
jgi:nicotinate-nucleotide pyrophosphorylase (carboxylating)